MPVGHVNLGEQLKMCVEQGVVHQLNGSNMPIPLPTYFFGAGQLPDRPLTETDFMCT